MGMSREHLYKAKRVNWRELPKEEWWVEGCFITDEQDETKAYIGYLFGVDDDGTVHDIDIAEVDPNTICEYTGRMDKNRRRIFEQDIVKAFICIDDHNKPLYEYGKIIYDGNDAAFLISQEDKYPLEKIRTWNNIEVIGNIFYNAELLKGENE